MADHEQASAPAARRARSRWSGSRLHEGRECVGPVRMPARERGAVLDDVVRSPLDATLVDCAGALVVRAQDVEVARREMLEHEIDDLVARPCPRCLATALRA